MIIKLFFNLVNQKPNNIAIITENKKFTYFQLFKLFCEIIYFLKKKKN